MRFDGTSDAIWAGLARHCRPIQYAHIATALTLWDVWTPIAATPVALERQLEQVIHDIANEERYELSGREQTIMLFGLTSR